MQVLFNVLMGHAKEIITMDIYGDNKGIIADCVLEIQDYMEEVLLFVEEEKALGTGILDIVIDTSELVG